MTDAEALYSAVLNSSTLSKLDRLQYRCPSRCLLLDVIDVGELGVVLHQTRFKYSPDENPKRSNEAGRANNTFDGVNHWRPSTFMLTVSALNLDDPKSTQALSCDHVLGHNLPATQFAEDRKLKRTHVVLRGDGTRYAR